MATSWRSSPIPQPLNNSWTQIIFRVWCWSMKKHTRIRGQSQHDLVWARVPKRESFLSPHFYPYCWMQEPHHLLTRDRHLHNTTPSPIAVTAKINIPALFRTGDSDKNSSREHQVWSGSIPGQLRSASTEDLRSLKGSGFPHSIFHDGHALTYKQPPSKRMM